MTKPTEHRHDSIAPSIGAPVSSRSDPLGCGGFCGDPRGKTRLNQGKCSKQKMPKLIE